MSAAKLYRAAPLELITNVEERLRKKKIFVNKFNSSINNLREMINLFKDLNHKSKTDFR